jgi:hypothetical protein
LSRQAAQLSFAPKGYKFRLSRQAAQLSFIYFITAPYAAYDMRMLQLFIYDGLGNKRSQSGKSFAGKLARGDVDQAAIGVQGKGKGFG